MEWIKLTDRLPNEEEPVLVYVMCGGLMQILIGAYIEKEESIDWYDWSDDETFYEEPLYWQPLPKAPK
jgi:hypothetical protein